MAKPREELQSLLEKLIGSSDVYFQPPESYKINYPCVIYERVHTGTDKANNKNYMKYNRYTVTVIDEDPDSELSNKVLELPYCSFDRRFVSDNLNHDVFTLYF